MASNHSAHLDERHEADDWLELRSRTGSQMKIGGLFLIVGNDSWQLPENSTTNTAGYGVIWADGQPEQGALHAPFTLPKDGATILLIDRDGSTLLDAFSYTGQRSDVSFGRLPNTTSKAAFFPTSTPGKANTSPAFSRILPAPETSLASGYFQQEFQLELHAHQGTIRYTLDGSPPSKNHGHIYDGPFKIEGNCVLRAVQFAEGQLPSEELVRTFVFGSGEQFAALVVDPVSLWNDSIGIYVQGASDNYSRQGNDWERVAYFQLVDEKVRDPKMVDLGISGNGSRALPKRSFTVHGRKRYGSSELGVPGIVQHSNIKLRADAAGGGHLKDRFVAALNERSGNRLCMLPAQAVDLYLNAEYWGVYELMPTKGLAFLQSQSDAQAFDILTGTSGELRMGDRKAYRELLALANDPDLPSGSFSAQLSAMVDLDNFIDHWIFEVFTAKVDNAANLRYWRPKQVDGRWRWITYDMDLWGDPKENSLARVLDHTDLHEYALPGLLLQDPLVRERFINRAADLLNTTFLPKYATMVLDSIAQGMSMAIARDRQRWGSEMNMPSDLVEQMSRLLEQRPKYLIGHIAKHFQVKPMEIDLWVSAGGEVKVNSVDYSGHKKLTYFTGNQIRLEAIPKSGYRFAGWGGTNHSNETVLYADPKDLSKLKVKFVKELGRDSLQDALEERTPIGVP